MAVANILTLIAVILLIASVVVTVRGRIGYRLARRTWLIVAGIFLVVSTWLRFISMD